MLKNWTCKCPDGQGWCRAHEWAVPYCPTCFELGPTMRCITLDMVKALVKACAVSQKCTPSDIVLQLVQDIVT